MLRRPRLGRHGGLPSETSPDDHRRVVNLGIMHGRDAEIASMQAVAGHRRGQESDGPLSSRHEGSTLSSASTVSRDARKPGPSASRCSRSSRSPPRSGCGTVIFDADQIDAAIAELDARFLAGEAAAHAHTWTAIVGAYAAINRHELPSTTTDFEDEDHRRGAAFEPGSMIEYLRAGWDLGHNDPFLHRSPASTE